MTINTQAEFNDSLERVKHAQQVQKRAYINKCLMDHDIDPDDADIQKDENGRTVIKAPRSPIAGDNYIRIDAFLTSMSLKRIQDPGRYKAAMMTPSVSSSHDTGTYQIFDLDAWIRNTHGPRVDGQKSRGSSKKYANDTFKVEWYSGREEIGTIAKARADNPPYDLEAGAVEGVSHGMMQLREADWVNTFMPEITGPTDTDNPWLSGNTDSTKKWDGSTTDDIIADVFDAKEKVDLASRGFEPNDFVIGVTVYRKLKTNEELIARMNGGSTMSQRTRVDEDGIAALLELDNVSVCKALTQTAPEGSSEADLNAGVEYFVGDRALLHYKPMNLGYQSNSATGVFTWQHSGLPAVGMGMRSWFDIETETTVYEGNQFFQHKVLGKELAFYWSNLVA